jgi:Photosynthetic reaction centre cytochrome C subunit
MLHYRKIAVALTLTAFMAMGMAATRPPGNPALLAADRIGPVTDNARSLTDKARPMDDNPPKRNLKVLPKDISHEDLGKVMDVWKTSLGVKCGFCHAPVADSTSHHLDFASDAKPEKNIARHMFRMTAKINKKYFSFDKDDKGNAIPAISCMTCHRGSPHPEGGGHSEGH